MSKNQSDRQISPATSYGTNPPNSFNDIEDIADTRDIDTEDFPSQMTVGSIVSDSEKEASKKDNAMADNTQAVNLSVQGDSSNFESLSSKREQELLTLIHDLNECNDVLLSKVSRLEAALKAPQQSVRPEVEGSQEKLAEQLLAQPAMSQQTVQTVPDQTVQQQVIRLAGQLETAKQTLQRQQLIQGTLQVELNDAQARVGQLERECALVTQQHADEAQARIKSDTTNRDLRSRLQRQQRYTLQFKAALEKSLSVNATPVTASIDSSVWFDGQDESSSVPMPRAERIVPWAAIGSTTFTGIDPHLESLIRGQKVQSLTDPNSSEASRSEISSISTHAEAEPALPSSARVDQNTQVPVIDAEVEKTLWQDIERIMGPSANAIDDEHHIEAHNIPATKAEAVRNTEGVPSVDAEPLLNWQTEALPIDPTGLPAKAQSLLSDDLSAPGLDNKPAQTNQEQLEQAHSKRNQPEMQDATYVRSTDSESSTGSESTVISPLLNPLRAHRKIDSLAAVQLPTFEKTEER